MNQYENREAKKILFLMALAMALAAICMGLLTIRLHCEIAKRPICMGLLTIWQCSRMRERENAAVFALVEQIRQQYPQVDEDTLMQTLNDVFNNDSTNPQGTDDTYDADTAQELRDLWERYGIRENDWAVAAQAAEERRAIVLNAILLLLAEGLIVALFVLYLRRRKERLDQLTLYMERISMGQYDLDLLDNSEDELSNLKNQLYKIMIYLKEQADRERDSRKVLADSVSDISHQLKTPLTSAVIMLDNLTDNPDMDPATRRKFIAEAARQVDSMKWMIVSMLKLSRLDAGIIEFEEKEFSLDEMIASGAESLEVLAELKSQTVEIAGAKGAYLTGDFRWNREAFVNILKNAIEHSPEEAKITVKVEENAVYTAIAVSNPGEPISREMERQIFRRYYSAARSADDNAGIGLPLAKAIVERQKGYLSVDSADGENTFTIKYLK